MFEFSRHLRTDEVENMPVNVGTADVPQTCRECGMYKISYVGTGVVLCGGWRQCLSKATHPDAKLLTFFARMCQTKCYVQLLINR